MFGEQQKREIETIKERNITIKLSDADCEKIYNLCGEHNITVANLLENFIGDLVCGTYTNGSDERMYADEYFKRCWFGMIPHYTLFNYLLYMNYDVYDDFLEIIDDIENGYAELEDYKKDPSVFDIEKIEFLKVDIKDWEESISIIKADYFDRVNYLNKIYHYNVKIDWDKEVEKVTKWWKERERFINGY